MFWVCGLGAPVSLPLGAKPPIRLGPGREIFGAREKFGGLEIPGPPWKPPPATEGGMNPPEGGPMLGGGPGGGPGKPIASVPISSEIAPTTKADVLSSFDSIVTEKIQVVALKWCAAPRFLKLMAGIHDPECDSAIPK